MPWAQEQVLENDQGVFSNNFNNVPTITPFSRNCQVFPSLSVSIASFLLTQFFFPPNCTILGNKAIHAIDSHTTTLTVSINLLCIKQRGNGLICMCDRQLLRSSFLGTAATALCQSINFKPRANKSDKGLREKLPSRLCQHGAGEPSWLPSSQTCQPADSLCPLCCTRRTLS